MYKQQIIRGKKNCTDQSIKKSFSGKDASLHLQEGNLLNQGGLPASPFKKYYPYL